MGHAHWLAFFGMLLVCWALLASMAAPEELLALEAVYGASLIEMFCAGPAGGASYPSVMGMWALMSAAMMAPTALPAFTTYDDLRHATHVPPSGFAKLLAGYLSAWLGFSAAAAALQVALYNAGLIGSFGQSLSAALTSALLIGAGLYQFSQLKEACLSRCRAPLTFFMQHWDEGPFRNGLRLGLDCVGCCWALMLLGFVGGAMDITFMGLAMVLMTLEKLPDIGRRLTQPLGWGLILFGLATLIL
ncbi:MAG: DUF2182 domain-containing protein [Rhodobacteraceae bacterium]|nr:DUF2182 domain-containing protein [Paracoccaceae bacterium]